MAAHCEAAVLWNTKTASHTAKHKEKADSRPVRPISGTQIEGTKS
jgi:hypothetical protein